jgi:hypothetical protein
LKQRLRFWYQVYLEPDMAPVLAGIEKAVSLGCKAVCVTVGQGAGFRRARSSGCMSGTLGLAAYSSDGVDTVLKMLQSETARTTGNCCKVNLVMLDRTLVRTVRR